MALAEELRGVVGMIKIGLEAFTAHGPDLVLRLRELGHEIFLDLKLHDIPNTVNAAMGRIAKLDVSLTTVHASGGAEMIRAAVEARGATRLLAVTVLTSLDDDALARIGFASDSGNSVEHLTKLAAEAGADGVVASPLEIETVRRVDERLLIVTPGIRKAGSDSGDQKRTATPGEAIRRGADWLVIGRPITQAEDPRGAAEQIIEELGIGSQESGVGSQEPGIRN